MGKLTLLLLLLSGCCGTRETVIQYRDVKVPVIRVDSIPASPVFIRDTVVSFALEDKLVDSLLSEIINLKSVRSGTQKLTWRATHVTPSTDSVDVSFTLKQAPYFSFYDRRADIKVLDTLRIVKYEELSFVEKVGIAAIGFVLGLIGALVFYLLVWRARV